MEEIHIAIFSFMTEMAFYRNKLANWKALASSFSQGKFVTCLYIP